MSKAYVLSVKTDNGREFEYTVDPSGMIANYGSILNTVNRRPIEGIIKNITENIVNKMIKDEILVKEFDGEIWNYDGMIGKYFDNEGIIYRIINNELIPSIHKSKYLCNKFNEL
jgi:phosphopantothenoylcysteine synthetase/decarboxylase